VPRSATARASAPLTPFCAARDSCTTSFWQSMTRTTAWSGRIAGAGMSGGSAIGRSTKQRAAAMILDMPPASADGTLRVNAKILGFRVVATRVIPQ
jgi:hypothetical protein